MSWDGAALHALIERLFPITRSITGDGVRETLAIIGEHIPLAVTEVPTGTPVLDWSVPREWNIREAYIAGPDGRHVVDMRDSNLHVMSYSLPVDAEMDLDALRPHLHSLPEHPTWIPYRTSYYTEAWGFCLTHEQLSALPEQRYHVRIDATLADGSLTYAECLLPGETEEEVLFSAHTCHPSLANDNLSSIALATALAAELVNRPHRYTYRFLFAPGTIGAISWLAQHAEVVQRIRHGMTLACLGDRGGLTYKHSRTGAAVVDRAAEQVLAGRTASRVIDFVPYGYDERQFGSPGFNLAVGSLSRTPYDQYPEYHTSADNLDFVSPDALSDSLDALRRIVDVLEGNRRYTNLAPYGEPQLGRRGLYPGTGGKAIAARQLAYLWVLNQADGTRDLLSIAERSGIPFGELAAAADELHTHGLLRADD